MRKKGISFAADCLTAYAIERQNGWERHQPDDAPPWQELRRTWTASILQGMASLEGLAFDSGWMERFDCQLAAARGCTATETLSPEKQKALIGDLNRYILALEATGDDCRRQIAAVRDLLKDMSIFPSWNHCGKELFETIGIANHLLKRMTAQKPIRFTYITLSGGLPSCTSDFVSGAVKDVESVKATGLYQKVTQWVPDAPHWRASCSLYVGGSDVSASAATDADDFDMSIIREDEYNFLKQPGIRCVDHWETEITIYEYIHVLRIEPGSTPEVITVPNRPKSIQEAVGGHTEVLPLDRGVCLICNAERQVTGLPDNRQVGGEIMKGTFLIAGEEDGAFCSLSDADAIRYTEELELPMPEDKPVLWKFDGL